MSLDALDPRVHADRLGRERVLSRTLLLLEVIRKFSVVHSSGSLYMT